MNIRNCSSKYITYIRASPATTFLNVYVKIDLYNKSIVSLVWMFGWTAYDPHQKVSWEILRGLSEVETIKVSILRFHFIFGSRKSFSCKRGKNSCKCYHFFIPIHLTDFPFSSSLPLPQTEPLTNT
jgi:hypothetical protein